MVDVNKTSGYMTTSGGSTLLHHNVVDEIKNIDICGNILFGWRNITMYD